MDKLTMRLGELIDNYIKTAPLRDSSRQTYIMIWRGIQHSFPDKNIKNMQLRDIDLNCMLELVNKQPSRKTFLKAIYNFAKTCEYTVKNINFKAIRTRKVEHSMVPDDRLIAACTALFRSERRSHAFKNYMLMAYTGCRVGEIKGIINAFNSNWRTLKAQNYDGKQYKIGDAYPKGCVLVLASKTGNRKIYLPYKAVKLFETEFKPVSSNTLYVTLKRSYLRLFGELVTENIRNHSFRHFYISICRDLQINESVANDLVGHAEYSTHSLYGRSASDDVMLEQSNIIANAIHIKFFGEEEKHD